MLELMQVPRTESKLRVFSFKIQFESQVRRWKMPTSWLYSYTDWAVLFCILIDSTSLAFSASLLHWECFACWWHICALLFTGVWAKEESEYCEFGSWSGTFLFFILSTLIFYHFSRDKGFLSWRCPWYDLFLDVIIRSKVHQNWKGLCKQFSLSEMLWTRELLEVGKHLFDFKRILLLISSLWGLIFLCGSELKSSLSQTRSGLFDKWQEITESMGVAELRK